MNFITSFQAERLIAQIQSQSDPTSSDAKRAFQKLGKLGTGAIPKIIEAVGFSDKAVMDEYVGLLSKLTDDRSLQVVAKGLASNDPRTIKATARALAESRRYNVNQLVNLLGEDGYSKPDIVEILHKHKERLNIGRLLAHIGYLDPNEQAALFKLIGEIVQEESVPDLLMRLSGRDSIVKTHLIDIVSRFERDDVLRALQEQLEDPNKMVRKAALVGLSKRANQTSAELICKLLLDPDIDVMNKAVDVIIEMNQPDTVKYLLPALKSESEFSRRSAVEILNEIGTTASVKYLLEAVADDDWWVRSRASDALAKIGGPRVIDAVLELIKDKDENIRRAAIEIIEACGDKSTVDQLIEATKDPDWWVSERAADALAGLGDKRAVPALLEMLQRSERSAPVAIAALGKLGDSAVLKQLLPYTRNKEKAICIAAVQAVADLADEKYVDSVRTFLEKSLDAGNIDDTIARATTKAIQSLDGKLTLSGQQSSSKLRRTESAQAPTSRTRTPPDRERLGRHDPDDDVNSTIRTLLSEGIDVEAFASRDEETKFLDIGTLEPGDIIDGRYKFVQKIGKGAFGTVLLVEDKVVQEQLILKFLNPNVASDEEMMKRFVHELRYSRRITHKNVIRIYDFLYIGGGYAISMEYFPSHTLGTEIAKESPMPIEKALSYALDICTGMEIAHQQGIIHRDLKPANLLINDEGLLKIVDFGVAAAAKSGDTQLTKTGYVIGSPKYMAPEQILGKKVDERADIYSLGVILYEMLSGSPPYSRGDHMSVMYQHVQGKAPPLSQREIEGMSDELSDIVSKAMAVDKAQRYSSMQEFHSALQEAAKALV